MLVRVAVKQQHATHHHIDGEHKPGAEPDYEVQQISHSAISARGLADEEREVLDVFECDTCTFGHGQQGIFGNMECDADFIGEALVKPA